jgi:uncharacterized protein (UPF0332 family)
MIDLRSNAREAAEEARLLFEARHFGGACSRAYYAMFNMARALLLERGHPIAKTKTHKSVLQQFSLEFVKSGPFDQDDGRALRRAADARHLADYEGGVAAEEAGQVMAALEKFIRKAELMQGGIK